MLQDLAGGWRDVHREQGVTLLEVIMLVAIIGMLAAMSIPRIGSMAGYAAHATARQIIADMRYTRGQAISTAKDHIVRFSPSGGPHTGYSIFRVEDAVEEQVGQTRQIRDQVSCSGPDEFTFYPFGNASSDGTISLVGAEDQYDINVIAATGRVY